MPHTKKPELRKHLIILLIALVLALSILVIWVEPANASAGLDSSDVASAQVFTTERLLILGMLGLIAATYLYLRLRPPYDPDDQSRNERE